MRNLGPLPLSSDPTPCLFQSWKVTKYIYSSTVLEDKFEVPFSVALYSHNATAVKQILSFFTSPHLLVWY